MHIRINNYRYLIKQMEWRINTQAEFTSLREEECSITNAFIEYRNYSEISFMHIYFAIIMVIR